MAKKKAGNGVSEEKQAAGVMKKSMAGAKQ